MYTIKKWQSNQEYNLSESINRSISIIILSGVITISPLFKIASRAYTPISPESVVETSDDYQTPSNQINLTLLNADNTAAIVEEPTPYVITPTDYTYGSIYKVIDDIKEKNASAQISMPILYNIEKYMTEGTIRANCLMAQAFCDKLSANGFYVGLYGTEESMRVFEEKFLEVTGNTLEQYDKLIKYSGDTCQYDGNYNMSQNKDGKISYRYDLQKVIKENDLNNPSNYLEDEVYTIKDGERLSEIAETFEIKTSDLASYNDIDDPDIIQTGQTIIIPNKYQPAEKILEGIDVSSYQGNPDWEVVAQNADFVIVKVCDFYNIKEDGTCKLDSEFLENMAECERLNIPVGVYYYSRATTCEEALKEAMFVAEILKNYTLEYPVYMDIETKAQNKMINENSQEIKDIVTTAMTYFEEQGYYAGVYCNGNTKIVGRKAFIDEMSQRYTFWLARPNNYNDEVDFDTFEITENSEITSPIGGVHMYQYTQNGKIKGINGNVDINYASSLLEETIAKNGFAKVKK